MSARTGLAAINFFLADVAGGLGPFLATWLAGAAHWSPERVGIVMTMIGLAGIVFSAPAGALVDAIGRPRLLLAAGTFVVATGTLALLPARTLGPVLLSQIAVAAAAALIAPALTSLTLGIVGKDAFPSQQGHNQAWNHAGNVVASALIAWLAGTAAGVSAFWVFAGMAVASGLALLMIRSRDVDPERARGHATGASPVPLRSVLTEQRVLLVCIGLMMFHLSNAAMLPLLGQRMADVGHGNATRWLAICVIVAQLTMVGVAMATAWASMRVQRSWLFLIPCLVLPVRGAMAAFAWAPEWLLPIQVLDACGAGLLGVSLPILIADYTWGSGHTQTALGVAGAFQGVGAALSTTLGGVLVAKLGWSWAFLGLSAPAMLALAIALRLHCIGAPAAVALRGVAADDRAQEAAMELYIIARFHAREGAQDEVAAALRAVAPPTRAEPGCRGIKAFAATRDPRLFFIHSRWVDEAAFEHHATLPHTVRFIERVQALIDHELEVVRVRRLCGE